MDPERIIKKYYKPDSLAFRILILHSQAVTRKAVEIATRMEFPGQDVEFIREAALLHDIGIIYTLAPEIGCNGHLPYICHGFMGHDLLVAEGLPKHALVSERHTGTGLSLSDIGNFRGLLPDRPMEPISLEEKLIAYCDKFFSKDPDKLEMERSYSEILEGIARYGADKVILFEGWHDQFKA